MKGIAGKFLGLATLAGALGGNGFGGEKLQQQRDLRSKVNPHNFPRFETNGFVSFSVNEEAHAAKYAKYCKKAKTAQP